MIDDDRMGDFRFPPPGKTYQETEERRLLRVSFVEAMIILDAATKRARRRYRRVLDRDQGRIREHLRGGRP